MSLPRRRFWLITISISAHVGLFVGVFISNIWRLDRLDVDHQSLSLAVMEPPAPSGGPPSLPTPKLTLKPHVIPPVLVQLVPKPTVVAIATVDPEVTPGDNGEGEGHGSGSNPFGKPDDTGTCAVPPCGEVAKPPIPVEPPKLRPTTPISVSSPELKALRYAGKTDLVPSESVKMQMVRDDHMKSMGMFKICLSDTGAISSVTMVRSTSYGDYDRTLAEGIRGWLYHPYTVDGHGVPACGMVTFMYGIK